MSEECQVIWNSCLLLRVLTLNNSYISNTSLTKLSYHMLLNFCVPLWTTSIRISRSARPPASVTTHSFEVFGYCHTNQVATAQTLT